MGAGEGCVCAWDDVEEEEEGTLLEEVPPLVVLTITGTVKGS